jgi:hypothetical protein
VAGDRLQDLGGDHREVRLLVQAVQQLAHLRLGEEEAEVLVPVARDGHADAVQQRAERDDYLGVVALVAVVAHHRRLDAVLHELPEELERDVRDDLDVHPGVVVDLHPQHGVDVRHVPPALQLGVAVHALHERPELSVAAHGDADAHRVDRLRRRHARLAAGLLRDGLLDPLRLLLGLSVDRHRRLAYVGGRR